MPTSIHGRDRSFYFFGPDGPGRQLVLERTTSGNVSINETILHYAQDDIPFGGVGPCFRSFLRKGHAWNKQLKSLVSASGVEPETY